MPFREVGQRVGAIRNAVYEGDHIPPEEIGLGFLNPRIKLDNGGTIYGCQCWWASEEHIKREIGDRRVIEVSVGSSSEG